MMKGVSRFNRSGIGKQKPWVRWPGEEWLLFCCDLVHGDEQTRRAADNIYRARLIDAMH